MPLLLAALALTTACGGSDIPTPPEAHGRDPIGLQIPDLRGERPAPQLEGGAFSGGQATVQITGHLDQVLQLRLSMQVPSAFGSGSLAGAWEDDDGNLLTIIGSALAPGRHETSPKLRLLLVVRRDLGFPSERGECVLDVSRAEASVVAGSFQCRGLGERGARIAAQGTFAAIG